MTVVTNVGITLNCIFAQNISEMHIPEIMCAASSNHQKQISTKRRTNMEPDRRVTRLRTLDKHNDTINAIRERWKKIEEEKKKILDQLKSIKKDITDDDTSYNIGFTVRVKCADLIEAIEMDPFAIFREIL